MTPDFPTRDKVSLKSCETAAQPGYGPRIPTAMVWPPTNTVRCSPSKRWRACIARFGSERRIAAGIDAIGRAVTVGNCSIKVWYRIPKTASSGTRESKRISITASAIGHGAIETGRVTVGMLFRLIWDAQSSISVDFAIATKFIFRPIQHRPCQARPFKCPAHHAGRACVPLLDGRTDR